MLISMGYWTQAFDLFPVICLVDCVLEDARGWVNFHNTGVRKHIKVVPNTWSYTTISDRWTPICMLYSFKNVLLHHFGLLSFQKVWKLFLSFPPFLSPFVVRENLIYWSFHPLALQSYVEWWRPFLYTWALFVIDTNSFVAPG